MYAEIRCVGAGDHAIPAVTTRRRDVLLGVICDGFGAWDDGELGARLVAPALLELLPGPGEPLIRDVEVALREIGPAVGASLPKGPDFDGASFGLLAARLTRDRVEIASIGGLQATQLRDGTVVARSNRQLLADRLVEEGRPAPPPTFRRIWASSASLDTGGTFTITSPWGASWEAKRGDRVLLASARLTERASLAPDGLVERLLDASVSPEAVAALPFDAEDDPHRWSERCYSAITMGLGPRP